jgi:hypothetical protein
MWNYKQNRCVCTTENRIYTQKLRSEIPAEKGNDKNDKMKQEHLKKYGLTRELT